MRLQIQKKTGNKIKLNIKESKANHKGAPFFCSISENNNDNYFISNIILEC